MGLAYYPKNATYQVVKNYDLTIFIINSNRSYTWKMEFPNSNQAGYFFNLGLACNNENCLNRQDGWVNGLPNTRGGTNEEIIWL